ncbi:hypothetical protein GCM10010383_49650 [Streptomyces lomondensis]|uniref:Uncharacterized protein n=1 Tax=Streptomyces lomondensis TaxID=68229 RepID=A0ABQ2XEI5_9ACTN|nr:hypothetical protein GCM10010383_49650 [Streptomyces lomondensis]
MLVDEVEVEVLRQRRELPFLHPLLRVGPEAHLSQLDQFEVEAHSRGVTHTTYRRITEALNLNGSLREDLRQLLINSRPKQYDAPLWRITATTE